MTLLLAAVDAEEAHTRTARQFRWIPSEEVVPRNKWPSYHINDPYGPGTYAFGYEIEDPQSSNIQFRDEERLPDGSVRGR